MIKNRKEKRQRRINGFSTNRFSIDFKSFFYGYFSSRFERGVCSSTISGIPMKTEEDALSFTNNLTLLPALVLIGLDEDGEKM